MGPKTWLVVVGVAVACAGCGANAAGGEAQLTPADAAKLPKTGQLWGLCPVPDVPQDFRERVSRKAQQRARALIREVLRRPEALVTLAYEDAHSGEPFTETMTVRELAREHLANPGVEGVPCQRKLMAELEAAVDGRRVRPVENERLYTLDEVVTALGLEKHGGIYTSPDACTVQDLYFERRDVEAALDEPIRNNVVVASPNGRVGVQVFKPDRRCREGIARDLARLDAGKR
jgi:hypothetical protein